MEVVAKDIGPITKRLEDIRYIHFISSIIHFISIIIHFISIIIYFHMFLISPPTRLMESRKSARLLNTDTDFSRLADFNIVEQVWQELQIFQYFKKQIFDISIFQ